MAKNGRFIPPSSERLAAAAAKGHLPRSSVFTAGCALLFTAGMIFLLKESLAETLLAGIRSGIQNAMSRQLLSPPVESIWPFALVLAAPFIGALIGQSLPLFWIPRGKGSTSVPIPRPDYPQAEIGVFRCLGLVVIGLYAIYRFRNVEWPNATVASLHNTPLFAEVMNFSVVLGMALLVVGIHEMIVRRRALSEALLLNRSEFERELRAKQGGGLKGKQRQRLMGNGH